MIPTELGITLAEARQKNPELKAAIENEPATQQLWEYATVLEGLTRGAGIHAAGVVIGDCELDEHVPLTRGKEGEVVTQYAMRPLADLGLLKMDFLGLKTLTVIQDAVDADPRAQRRISTSTTSPLDDKPTFDLLNARRDGRRVPVGIRRHERPVPQFGVDRIEDIIALIALYRPGPMDLIPDFIDRKKGKKKVEYLHPLLEQVREETYGILIYQEQVQQAANVLAGYTLGEADLLRRAMGKKKLEEMAKQREIFVEGCSRGEQHPGEAGQRDLRLAGEIRRLRIQQVALRRLRLDQLPDRLPEGELPGRVHGGAAEQRDQQHRQDLGLRRRVPAHGDRDPAAGRQPQRAEVRPRGR